MSIQPDKPKSVFSNYVQSLTAPRWHDLPHVTELRNILKYREHDLQETHKELRSLQERHREMLDTWEENAKSFHALCKKHEATIARLQSSVDGLKVRNDALNRDLARYKAQAAESAKPLGMDRHLAAENAELKRRLGTIRANRDELADALQIAEARYDELRTELDTKGSRA